MIASAAELDKLRALTEFLRTRSVLPSSQARPTRLAMERVLRTLDASTRPPRDRLEEARRAILDVQRRGGGLFDLPQRITRDSVWLVWPEAGDGINRRALREYILNRIGTDNALLRRTIDAWITAFDKDDESFVSAGKMIDRALAAGHAGLLAHWAEAHGIYNIFDAVRGPERLASRILDDSSGGMVAAYRLDASTRAVSGYLRATHFALSAKLPKLLAGDGALETFQRAASFYAPGGALRFKDDRATHGAMADGMVGPWIGASRSPSDRLKKEVLAFLRLHLGDPRVERQSNWEKASEETRQTVRGWLSALSLDAFFDIIGRFAGKTGMGHHWPARRAFWQACLKAGRIRDSWLILGDNVARAIGDSPELRDSYGRFRDSVPNQSVLLIQIGDLVFSEWTFNGRLRTWKCDSQDAPKMFRSRYDRSTVMRDGLRFPPPRDNQGLGYSSPKGIVHNSAWQGRTAALLREREGINLNPNDWR
jgi:hypothetical protein